MANLNFLYLLNYLSTIIVFLNNFQCCIRFFKIYQDLNFIICSLNKYRIIKFEIKE